jgi:hypothetical protein
MGHAALAAEQVAVVPPPVPMQPQVRVVPQAVWPLSPVTLPALQVAALPPHAPLTTEHTACASPADRAANASTTAMSGNLRRFATSCFSSDAMALVIPFY